jgi:hypothetical protein
MPESITAQVIPFPNAVKDRSVDFDCGDRLRDAVPDFEIGPNVMNRSKRVNQASRPLADLFLRCDWLFGVRAFLGPFTPFWFRV